jgi:hypothetical protein
MQQPIYLSAHRLCTGLVSALASVLAMTQSLIAQNTDLKISYTGNIKNIPIQMTLQQKVAGVVGTYRYVKIGTDLGLEGSLRGKDSLILFEYDESGKQTGLFKGRFKGAFGTSELIEGTWSKPNGSKSLPFALRRIDAAPASVTVPRRDDVTGRYKRDGKHSSEVNVQQLANGDITIEGESFWIGNNDNIHTGDISGICRLQGNQASYADKNMPCRLTLTFHTVTLTINGDDGSCGGQNVTFNGLYKRISKTPIFQSRQK